MASQAYSVLMSIYLKENPAYLRASLDSIINQTIPPAEIVMVKDGPLTKELDSVLAEYDRRYPGIFSFIAYEENHGLAMRYTGECLLVLTILLHVWIQTILHVLIVWRNN